MNWMTTVMDQKSEETERIKQLEKKINSKLSKDSKLEHNKTGTISNKH